MIIQNGMIHDAVHKDPYKGDILVVNGKIQMIAETILPEEGEEVYDAEGKGVYPGFVDAHSHLGLDGYGIGYEGADFNEMNNPCMPELRGIDSFNPMDMTVVFARKSGVTTVGTGPGSANVLGGTFFAVKTAGISVDEMILRNPVAMKCAFGENPKRCYRDKGISARMTNAAILRNALFKAKEYMAKKELAGDDL